MKSSDTKTTLSASADDFFESFCELHEDENVTHITENDSSDDSFSQDDSVILKSFTEDFKSIEDPKDDNSYAESVKSVIENNMKSMESLDKTLMGAVIAKDLNLQLEEAKENIECIEKFIEMSDIEKASENESGMSAVEYKNKQSGTENKKFKPQNNVITIWSRLVTFAYQIIKINHGNCHYDYSSQFLTAVLACDVLRRGISRMCNILQPYVSPIKFATDDESDSSVGHYKIAKRKQKHLKKNGTSFGCKIIPNHKGEFTRKHGLTKKYCSEDYWRQNSKSSVDRYKRKKNTKWASEPWRSVPRFTINKDHNEHSSCDSIWPEFSHENILKKNHSYDCSCCKRFRNPMLKIARYIDRMLKDLEDCY
ncbi:hypothetical protein O3G_MSEX006538 [Manduca sexta]|nr:hypothetical protein O3G_MSEX006538 [Manduca sexta]